MAALKRQVRPWIIPHSPPINTQLDITHSGKHLGSTAVREFIERSQPDVAICGHIHEARGVDVIGRSQIVNCGPVGKGCYVLITVDDQISISLKP
ncbi:MAG: metallophosphoesterase [Ignavibacteriae bacterium]|nr:metallophosphoesterase [Ignavibacteriota bacterium]